jgi:hypothetical protein
MDAAPVDEDEEIINEGDDLEIEGVDLGDDEFFEGGENDDETSSGIDLNNEDFDSFDDE